MTALAMPGGAAGALDARGEHVSVQVTHDFAGLRVLDDVHFSVAKNEFLCLVGPSGCGKTTLSNLMAGLMPPTQGRVLIDGQPVDPSLHNIAFVFQEPSLWPWRNVWDNVKVGLEIKGHARREQQERIRRMLGLVNLNGFEQYFPYQISGGMKQRVAIARAFVLDADLVLMDEPFVALDAHSREQMQAEVLRVWENARRTVVFVTHNLEEALFLAERVIVLSAKPARIREEIRVDLPRPRDFTDPAFVRLRKHLHDLIVEVTSRTALG